VEAHTGHGHFGNHNCKSKKEHKEHLRDEQQAPFVSESALLFKALLDKLMQGGEYCEDLE
jgi:hypothetical protein